MLEYTKMSNKIQCNTHGECEETFVCTHLVGEATALGFNRDEPTVENSFPDAWCDDCELIRTTHGRWNEESENLVKISLLCSGCYERARIRNTRPNVTLDDLGDLRWKCSSCEEWHTGPCLDFGYDSPNYWGKEHAEITHKNRIRLGWNTSEATFLTEDFCAIEDRDFFIRGVLHLPIIGTAENFCWGVWGSVSRENFEKLREMDDDPNRVELPEMFSWLSSQIPEYPDTLNLKMYCRIQEVGSRPQFRLELTDHPLSQEYHKGITPARVKEIMLARLRSNES